MNRIALTLMAMGLAVAVKAATLEPVDYVNPLVGTQSSFELSTGNTYPAIAMPWGMNFWVPQTGKNGDGWQYTYTANKIRGFKQTHQPSPWINDYGQFSLMPTVGEPVFDENERASWFSHKAETATPYYYKVYLADYDVTAEVAPTERAAIMRFTFPETDKANVVVDAFDGAIIAIMPQTKRIVGFARSNCGGVPDGFCNYFEIRFDTPFHASLTANDSILQPGSHISGSHVGAIVTFDTHGSRQVVARVASSFISPEQAELNLKELQDDDLETIAMKGRQRWNEVLGRIQVDDDNVDHLRTFYSCLYRSVLFPRSLYDIKDGMPRHRSPYNGEIVPGRMFTDTGFWDTFRALMPLVDLVYPTMGSWMQEGLVNTWLESGFLPEWASPGHRDCMVGNNSASVVADAYLKGLRGYDIDKLWQAVVHGTTAVHPQVKSTGRLGHEYYNQLGYIPYDVGIKENVARTLEYAYDDWCIYRLGRALGKPGSEIGVFRERAMNYRNVFDCGSRLMRGRNSDGTWSVFHDPQGLIDLMGGRETFCAMLDSVFAVPPIFDDSYYGFTIHEIREMQIMNMGNYAHGNQPIQHMIYLYCYGGEPWKAQYWLRQVMDRLYSANSDGYCGDEDNGQTSAWYVFTALGFYPVCPGSNQYVIGAPYLDKVTLHLEGGRWVTITREGQGCYIQSMTINGKPYNHNFITHDQLTQGCDIRFVMGEKPNKNRGTSQDDLPYSFSTSADKP